MNRWQRAAGLAAVLLFVSVSAAAAAGWEIDSAHSQANFTVKHLMITNVHGRFGGVKPTSTGTGRPRA